MHSTPRTTPVPLCSALPSFFWAALSLWLCSACILSCGLSLPFSKIAQLGTYELCKQVVCNPSVVLLSCVLALSSLILVLTHTKAAYFFIAGSILAFVFSLSSLALYANSLHQLADIPWNTTGNYTIHIEKDAQTKGAKARTTVTLYNEDGTLVLPSGLKCVCDMPAPDALVLTQSSMNVKATLRALKPDEYQRFAASHVVARLTVTHADTPQYRGFWAPLFVLRERLVACLVQRQTPESSLIAAITCGFRDSLASFDTYDVFKQAGLAHLIAVSGAHMSLLCGVVSSLLGKFHVARRILCALMISFMGLYLLISGFPISALRAAAMSCLALGAYFAKRRSNALQALCICVIVFIACDATCALSLSFALSALATGGILMFSRLFEWLLKRYVPFLKHSSSILSVSLAALIPTQPLSCAFFETLPLYSLCANILAAPFFIILCSGGSLALLVASFAPLVSDGMFAAVEACAFVLVAMLKVLNAAPFASLHVSISVPVALGISILLSGVIYSVWYTRTNPHAKRFWCFGACKRLGSFFPVQWLQRLGVLLPGVRVRAKRDASEHGNREEFQKREDCKKHGERAARAPTHQRTKLRVRIIGAVTCCFLCGASALYAFSAQLPLYRLTALSYDKQCCYLLTSQNTRVLINLTSNAAPLIDFLKRKNITTLNYVVLADDKPAYYSALIELYNAIPYQTLASFVDAPETKRQVNEAVADCSAFAQERFARDDALGDVPAQLACTRTLSNVIAYVSARGAAYQQLRYNDALTCGNAELRAVWPHRVHEAYRNGDSLALTLRLLSDAEKASPLTQTHDTSLPPEQTNVKRTSSSTSSQAPAAAPAHPSKHVSLIAPFLSFEELTDILLEQTMYDVELACVAPGVCEDPFTAGELHARAYVLSPRHVSLEASASKNSPPQNTTTSYDMERVKELSVGFTKDGMRIECAPP